MVGRCIVGRADWIRFRFVDVEAGGCGDVF